MIARRQPIPMRVLSLLACLSFLPVGAATLPGFDGPFPVGRRELIWKDSTRPEDPANPDGTARQIPVFVFYPARAVGQRAAYYPGLADLADGPTLSALKAQFQSSWEFVRHGTIQTDVFQDAPLANANEPFPVLIFSPGLGAPALAYTIQLGQLASHGYVVVALDHPYDTALVRLPDGRLIPYTNRPVPSGPPNARAFRIDAEREEVWTRDTQFAVSQLRNLNSGPGAFRGHLDVSKVGLFGHSMGGRVAVQACQVIPTLGACLNEDGGLFGVDFRSGEIIPFVKSDVSTVAPLLNVDVPLSPPPGALDAAGQKQFEKWQSSKARLLSAFLSQNSKSTYKVVIDRKGFAHGSFMDIRLLNSLSANQGTTNVMADLTLVNQITLAFFDDELKGKPGKVERLAEQNLPGVAVERVRDSGK